MQTFYCAVITRDALRLEFSLRSPEALEDAIASALHARCLTLDDVTVNSGVVYAETLQTAAGMVAAGVLDGIDASSSAHDRALAFAGIIAAARRIGYQITGWKPIDE
ncbi:hypothetical protein [Azospirillum sp. Sh1]|uniref:hypothetical protein n=1 Tax=Azospirillum sp. Sh1 TaxID=2607285 RepID=UPI0011EC1EAB|nr:hypothetical protein [Azospirillum sp. Sh1]KAA0573455.1 hypothetical protein FZ029_20980 [Azospirillum sp. Sh1]